MGNEHLVGGVQGGVTHRLWPAPAARPLMDMSWHDLVFLHWPVGMERLRPLVPDALRVDTFEGQAWVGVVPFRMTRVKPRGFPPVPYCSAFLELNVRTYVTDGTRAGVWFFSLDAANPFAVAMARRLFHLPYFNARMSLGQDNGSFRYSSRRTHRAAVPALFEADYAPAGEKFESTRGSLEAWLTDRYCFYALDGRQRLWRTEVQHENWRLQTAHAEIRANSMTQPLGIHLAGVKPVAHFAEELAVAAWRPQLVARSGRGFVTFA